MKLTYGSLFAGVGGFDMGFDADGWENRWQVEKDPLCLDVLQRHWPEVPKYQDVCDISGHDIEPVDAILFGFPCQDLTFAQPIDKRSGLSGERSGLFFEAVRIIQEMRNETNNTYPRYAIAENVAGLLSAESGRSFLRVLEAMVELGAVAIEWRILDAQDFGLPQHRRRVFLVANFNSGAESGGTIFPQPQSLSRHHETNRKTRPDSTPGDESDSSGYPSFRRVRKTYIPSAVGATLLASKFGRETTLIKTQKSGGSYTLRRLSPLEAERMQGWPDFHTKYSSSGDVISDTRRFPLIGNGVASPCANWVARQIRAFDTSISPIDSAPRSPSEAPRSPVETI